jgi:hypothetical protein
MADAKNCNFPGCEAAGVSACDVCRSACCREHAVWCVFFDCDETTCTNADCVEYTFDECGECGGREACYRHADGYYGTDCVVCLQYTCNECRCACADCGKNGHGACFVNGRCKKCARAVHVPPSTLNTASDAQ